MRSACDEWRELQSGDEDGEKADEVAEFHVRIVAWVRGESGDTFFEGLKYWNDGVVIAALMVARAVW